MYADHKGTVDIVCKDGLLIMLSRVLYMSDLDINLLSARHIC
jgi:hypothetical protein